jgi:hypothetical protein
MSDNSKEELVSNIKEWIKLDNEITKFQNEIKDRKNKKKEMTNKLVSVMSSHNLDVVNINGGSILYKKNVVKKPINSKSLTSLLKLYYSKDPVHAEELSKYILENREVSIKETIKRKIDA